MTDARREADAETFLDLTFAGVVLSEAEIAEADVFASLWGEKQVGVEMRREKKDKWAEMERRLREGVIVKVEALVPGKCRECLGSGVREGVPCPYCEVEVVRG